MQTFPIGIIDNDIDQNGLSSPMMSYVPPVAVSINDRLLLKISPEQTTLQSSATSQPQQQLMEQEDEEEHSFVTNQRRVSPPPIKLCRRNHVVDEKAEAYDEERHSCLRVFERWTEADQVDFVQHLLHKMCHTQHGLIDSFLKPMLQRDFLSLLPKFYLDHLAEKILSYLDAKSLASCEAVCKQWNKVVCQGTLWKKLIERKVRNDPLWKGLSLRRGWKQYLYKAHNFNNALNLISTSMKQHNNTFVIGDPIFYEYFNANLCHLPPPSPYPASLLSSASSSQQQHDNDNNNNPLVHRILAAGRMMTSSGHSTAFPYPSSALMENADDNDASISPKNCVPNVIPYFTTTANLVVPGSLLATTKQYLSGGDGCHTPTNNNNNTCNNLSSIGLNMAAGAIHENCAAATAANAAVSSLTIASVLSSWFYKRLYASILSDISNLESNWREGKHYLRRIKCRSENSKGVYCLQYDDHKIVSGLRDNTIKIWDYKTLECVKVLTGHTGSVLCLQYDDRIIVTGSSDATVRIWDVTTGELLNTLIHHCEAVLHLRFDDGIMVTCSKDRSIAVWDMRAPKDISLRRVLVGHRAAVNVVDFDDKYIVSASGDRTIKVWDTSTCEFVRTLNGHKRGIACLQYRDRLIVSGSSDYTIRLWDIECGSCLRILEGHEELVRCIRFDNKRIVSGAYDGKIKVWDLAAALDPRVPAASVCVKTLVEHTGRVFRLQFDEFQIVSSSHDDTILVWDFLNYDGKNIVDTVEPLGGLTTMAVPLGPEEDDLLPPNDMTLMGHLTTPAVTGGSATGTVVTSTNYRHQQHHSRSGISSAPPQPPPPLQFPLQLPAAVPQAMLSSVAPISATAENTVTQFDGATNRNGTRLFYCNTTIALPLPLFGQHQFSGQDNIPPRPITMINPATLPLFMPVIDQQPQPPLSQPVTSSQLLPHQETTNDAFFNPTNDDPHTNQNSSTTTTPN